MTLASVLLRIGRVYGSSVFSEDRLPNVADNQDWQHFSPTFPGKILYSCPVFLQWTLREISNYSKQQCPISWHQVFSVAWNVFWQLWKCFLWSGGVLKDDHSLHNKKNNKLHDLPNKDFAVGGSSSNMFLVALESGFSRRILYYPLILIHNHPYRPIRYIQLFYYIPRASSLVFLHAFPGGFNNSLDRNWTDSFWNGIWWGCSSKLFLQIKKISYIHSTILSPRHSSYESFQCDNSITFCFSHHI